MNRRLLPLALVLTPALFVYACSSSSSNNPNPTPTPEASTGDTSMETPDTSMVDMDSSKTDTSVGPSCNPIEGIAAPTVVIPTVYFEGPQWVTDTLYLAAYGTTGTLLKFVPSQPQGLNNPDTVRTSANVILGTTLDEKTNTLVTVEPPSGGVAGMGGMVVRTPLTGALPRTGTPIALAFDGGGGLGFDSPNDLVVRKSDGTIYMTDPGYQVADQGTVLTNHIWRIKPTTEDVFEYQVDGRPNGIGLSPDDKTLYVSFTVGATINNVVATVPNILKYPVNVDGSLGVGTKFADVSPVTSAADGLAVDSAGNVYVAVSNGVDVFKKDGSAKWGHITTTGHVINGLAFGGTDKKTLYLTSDTGLLSVVVKVAGLTQ